MKDSHSDFKKKPPLPEDLAQAIERARSRSATPDMVERLTAKAIQLHELESPVLVKRAIVYKPSSRWMNATAVAVAVAILLLSAGTLPIWNHLFMNRDDFLAVEVSPLDQTTAEEVLGTAPSKTPGSSTVSYSPERRVELVLVAYRSIDDDLDQADAQVAEISEALQLVLLRHEIQSSLDEFYDWSQMK